MEKIVLFRSGAFGDCIISIPTLRLLRAAYPEARITVIGNPYSGSIFEGAPYWNDLHLLNYKPRFFRYLSKLLALRKNSFDVSVDFQATGRTRGQTALIGAKKRIAFDVKGIPDSFLYTDLVPHDRTIHAADRFANLLSPLGIQHTPEDLYPSLEISEEHRIKAAQLLRQNEVLKPFVVLQCTCGKRAVERHWNPENFAALADWFWEQGIQVVVSSATNDPHLQPILAKAKYSVTNLSGSTEPLVLAAILEQAALYVGYNTGPMHLAAAMGTPIVALIDLPNDLIEWAPLSRGPVRLITPAPVGSAINSIQVHQLLEATANLMAETPAPKNKATLK